MVVGIGPFGVESEYRCQPGSILAVSLASTRAPGGAAEGSSARDHFTGSAAARGPGRQREERLRPNPPSVGDARQSACATARPLAVQRCISFSMRLLISPLENSAATRM